MHLRASLCILLAVPLLAQVPEFDVASLKPNNSGRPGFSIAPLPGGKLDAANISLKRLIAVAYSVTDFQIYGEIDWLESQRYDMTARAATPAALPELRLMLRTLLADRFKLKAHRDTREMKLYTLAGATAGQVGSGLIEAPNGECSTAVTQQAALPNGTGCGVVNLGPGRINGHRARISQLADRLSTLLTMTVIDKTGLTGYYDITMTWTPDPDMERLMTGERPPVLDTSGPSLFTALQQQLGLKLVSGNGPVEVIVIDSAEKATEN
jgi:uncharacterized protein (TIGR03435 family)